jgi:WD40 repeat protein
MTIKDEMLFAGTGDGRIMAWKFPAKENNLGPVAILSGHERQVISLSVSATRLYSGSLDKTIRVRKCSRPAYFCWLLNTVHASDIFLVISGMGP